MVRDVEAAEVGHDEIKAGIVLAQYYASEALRLFGGSMVAPDLRLAQLLLGWLITSWGEGKISLPDIYQRGPSQIRDKGAAQKAVSILEDHGWLVRIPQGAVVAKVQRRDAWKIVGRA
jgi:hypothetical protein